MLKTVSVLLRINAWGVHLIFDIFFVGVYSREAFIRGRRLLQNTEKITILNISMSMISLSSILKTALSAPSTSGICDQNERVRTTRFVY